MSNYYYENGSHFSHSLHCCFIQFSVSDFLTAFLEYSNDFVFRLLGILNVFNFLFCFIVSNLLFQTREVSRKDSFKFVFIPYFTGIAVLGILRFLIALTFIS